MRLGYYLLYILAYFVLVFSYYDANCFDASISPSSSPLEVTPTQSYTVSMRILTSDPLCSTLVDSVVNVSVSGSTGFLSSDPSGPITLALDGTPSTFTLVSGRTEFTGPTVDVSPITVSVETNAGPDVLLTKTLKVLPPHTLPTVTCDSNVVPTGSPIQCNVTFTNITTPDTDYTISAIVSGWSDLAGVGKVVQSRELTFEHDTAASSSEIIQVGNATVTYKLTNLIGNSGNQFPYRNTNSFTVTFKAQGQGYLMDEATAVTIGTESFTLGLDSTLFYFTLYPVLPIGLIGFTLEVHLPLDGAPADSTGDSFTVTSSVPEVVLGTTTFNRADYGSLTPIPLTLSDGNLGATSVTFSANWNTLPVSGSVTVDRVKPHTTFDAYSSTIPVRENLIMRGNYPLTQAHNFQVVGTPSSSISPWKSNPGTVGPYNYSWSVQLSLINKMKDNKVWRDRLYVTSDPSVARNNYVSDSTTDFVFTPEWLTDLPDLGTFTFTEHDCIPIVLTLDKTTITHGEYVRATITANTGWYTAETDGLLDASELNIDLQGGGSTQADTGVCLDYEKYLDGTCVAPDAASIPTPVFKETASSSVYSIPFVLEPSVPEGTHTLKSIPVSGSSVACFSFTSVDFTVYKLYVTIKPVVSPPGAYTIIEGSDEFNFCVHGLIPASYNADSLTIVSSLPLRAEIQRDWDLSQFMQDMRDSYTSLEDLSNASYCKTFTVKNLEVDDSFDGGPTFVDITGTITFAGAAPVASVDVTHRVVADDPDVPELAYTHYAVFSPDENIDIELKALEHVGYPLIMSSNCTLFNDNATRTFGNGDKYDYATRTPADILAEWPEFGTDPDFEVFCLVYCEFPGLVGTGIPIRYAKDSSFVIRKPQMSLLLGNNCQYDIMGSTSPISAKLVPDNGSVCEVTMSLNHPIRGSSSNPGVVGMYFSSILPAPGSQNPNAITCVNDQSDGRSSICSADVSHVISASFLSSVAAGDNYWFAGDGQVTRRITFENASLEAARVSVEGGADPRTTVLLDDPALIPLSEFDVVLTYFDARPPRLVFESSLLDDSKGVGSFFLPIVFQGTDPVTVPLKPPSGVTLPARSPVLPARFLISDDSGMVDVSCSFTDGEGSFSCDTTHKRLPDDMKYDITFDVSRFKLTNFPISVVYKREGEGFINEPIVAQAIVEVTTSAGIVGMLFFAGLCVGIPWASVVAIAAYKKYARNKRVAALKEEMLRMPSSTDQSDSSSSGSDDSATTDIFGADENEDKDWKVGGGLRIDIQENRDGSFEDEEEIQSARLEPDEFNPFLLTQVKEVEDEPSKVMRQIGAKRSRVRYGATSGLKTKYI